MPRLGICFERQSKWRLEKSKEGVIGRRILSRQGKEHVGHRGTVFPQERKKSIGSDQIRPEPAVRGLQKSALSVVPSQPLALSTRVSLENMCTFCLLHKTQHGRTTAHKRLQRPRCRTKIPHLLLVPPVLINN